MILSLEHENDGEQRASSTTQRNTKAVLESSQITKFTALPPGVDQVTYSGRENQTFLDRCLALTFRFTFDGNVEGVVVTCQYRLILTGERGNLTRPVRGKNRPFPLS